jgi:hypothetical protein
MAYKGLRRTVTALRKAGYTVEIETHHRVIPLTDGSKAVEVWKDVVILDLPLYLLDKIPAEKGESVQMGAYAHLIRSDVYKLTKKHIDCTCRGTHYTRTRRIHGVPFIIPFTERILKSVYS